MGGASNLREWPLKSGQIKIDYQVPDFPLDTHQIDLRVHLDTDDWITERLVLQSFEIFGEIKDTENTSDQSSPPPPEDPDPKQSVPQIWFYLPLLFTSSTYLHLYDIYSSHPLDSMEKITPDVPSARNRNMDHDQGQ
jgi:hypothetical protein